jgi:uncharacterized membrane protein
MDKVLGGIFTDSDHAGQAVSELKNKGYTDKVSVIAKDVESGEVNSHQVKTDAVEDVTAGAVAGGALGGLAGILAGLSTVVLPGIGALIVAGPLTVAWGLTGGALGALTGGIVGALVSAGVPEEDAKVYEERILAGETLVLVTTSEENVAEARAILEKHGAQLTTSE